MKIKFGILIILALCISVGAGAQNTSAQEQKKAKLEKEIEIINRQLKDNAKKSKSALNDLALVRKKVSARRNLVRQSDAEIASLNKEIKSKQNSIDSLTRRLGVMSDSYSNLVRTTYKIRDTRLWYMYILAADNFPQATRRYAYLKKLASGMNVQALQMLEVKQVLDQEKQEIETLKEEAQKVRTARRKDLNSLRKDEQASAAVVNKLNKDKKTYQKQLADKKKQIEALNREIQRLIANAVKKGSGKVDASGKWVSSAVDTKLAGEFAANKGKLPWPVDGSVIDEFGQHNHPVYKSVKMPFNNGVTLAVNPGTKAKAVFEGTVQQIVVMPGYNQCVLVQHGNYFTFYCKLKSVAVKPGQKVSTGQVIGAVDTIGGETQMHFELWKDTVPQNPENWLR